MSALTAFWMVGSLASSLSTSRTAVARYTGVCRNVQIEVTVTTSANVMRASILCSQTACAYARQENRGCLEPFDFWELDTN